jgi:hypothetical protein
MKTKCMGSNNSFLEGIHAPKNASSIGGMTFEVRIRCYSRAEVDVRIRRFADVNLNGLSGFYGRARMGVALRVGSSKGSELPPILPRPAREAE